MEDFPFMKLLFGFLLVVWLVRLAFSKKKREVLKEGPVQMTYENGRTTRDLSARDIAIFGAIILLGFTLLFWLT
ncbi:MAG: hypothetical protein ACSHYA_20155 [Opitutaceae bacterium]